MNYWTFFSVFLHERYLLWYSLLKVGNLSHPPLVPFYFANHVYRKVITNDMWIKIYSLECSSPLKIQFYENFAVLFVIILIRLMQSHLRRGKRVSAKCYWDWTWPNVVWLLFCLGSISFWELHPPWYWEQLSVVSRPYFVITHYPARKKNSKELTNLKKENKNWMPIMP